MWKMKAAIWYSVNLSARKAKVKPKRDYEEKKFVAKSENITVGDLLDMWVEEELKPGNLSNGTVMSYMGTVARIKKHPIAQRKLKTVTADHLQSYMDLLSFGGKNPDGTTAKALSKGYIRLFSAVLQGAFRFAIFPKKLITFNPMQYVVRRQKKNVIELFSDVDEAATPTVTHKQYLKLTEYLKVKQNPALLPIQIAYYTGLRIGEVCGLTWSDINLDEQYLTVRRSIRYNGDRHKFEIGTTKRNKIRTVDFCDTLANILRQAKAEQEKNEKDYGELYSRNFYVELTEKDRQYYEVYSLSSSEEVPDGYKPINLVCLRPDGTFESPSTVGTVCRAIRKKVEGLENSKGRAGTARTFRRQYHNEHLRSRFKRSKAHLSPTARQGGRRIKNFPLFVLIRANTRESEHNLSLNCGI